VSRWWTDFVAAVSDVIPLPLLLLTMIVLALIVGALWYFFPAWVPRRLPRLRRPRWRWPRFRRWRIGRLSFRWRPHWSWRETVQRLLAWLRALRWPWRRRVIEEPTEPTVEESVPPADDALPTLPADALASLADRLAAQGRYAEAIRERLRAMVRLLVERGVIEDRPGWTVTELSAAAGLPPLREASTVFSDVWYAQRPATAELDARMRELGQQIRPTRRPALAGNGSLR
jgi:Domain of unknown function (DUF4129)